MLEKITEKMWSTSVDLKVAPGFCLPARMVVLEAAPGELLLYSPIKMDETLLADIREKGDVRWIIAPNDFHHMFVGDAARAFGDAEVWGSTKAVKKQKDVSFTGCLEESRPTTLPDSIVPIGVEGMPLLHETTLWAPDESALICCDLVMNIRNPSPWLTRMVLGFFLDRSDVPTQGKEYRWFFVKDRQNYAESMLDILDREFDVLSMSHGDIHIGGGNDALRTAVSWALPDQARLSA